MPLPSPWQKVFSASLPDTGTETGRTLSIMSHWDQALGAVTAPNGPVSLFESR